MPNANEHPSMKVFGIDFTSSPSAKVSRSQKSKWMYLATCELHANRLIVKNLERLNGDLTGDYTPLVTLLNSAGPWVAGIDAPFGIPIECIEYFNWLVADDTEQTWEKYVSRVRNNKTRKDFKNKIESWRHPTNLNSSGEKAMVRKFRLIDKLINSNSPMNCIRPAIGSMFFEACEILRATPASIPPVRLVQEEKRHIIEAYPRLVVNRLLVESKAYKESNDLEAVRHQIVTRLSDASEDSAIQRWYGISVTMDKKIANECITDWDGDKIDSILCAVQAAWAARQDFFGIPRFNSSVLNGVIALEGWIPDPFLGKWRANS
jgi:hypothetical protein